MPTPNNNLKTRYLVIRLDIAEQNIGTFTNNTYTKFIYAYSGNPDVVGTGYQKASCIIQAAIGLQDTVATVMIYGMSESDINTFTRTNLNDPVFIFSLNTVTIYAGYELGSDGLPPFIYTGNILRAAPDYNNSRDSLFIIKSQQLFTYQQDNIEPLNIKGIVSRENVLRLICAKAGLVYRGNQITGNDYNPIFTGSARNQLIQAAKKYNYQFKESLNVQQNQTTVYIAPINTALIESDFVLSAANGMIGYPVVEDMGFSAKTYFNPQLIVGQSIEVNSTTVPYINNRKLYINQMIHELHNREDLWMSTLQLNPWLTFPTGSL